MYIGYALIVGSKNVITFDGQRIEFDRGKCLYLLSHDFIDNSFSVTLESSDQWSNDDSEIISIFVDEHTISVDLIRKVRCHIYIYIHNVAFNFKIVSVSDGIKIIC